MGYVKTPEEVALIEEALSTPGWSGELLSIQFLTDPATLERLLPPPLEPAALPLATVTVGRWQSNCLGHFAGGTLSLAATHNGYEGNYVLVIYMDSEPPLVFGREVFGEPKKLARGGLFRDADHVHGWVERHGVRIFDLRADLHTDLGPADTERYTFNYKARTAANGVGLEEDAILTRTHFTTAARSREEGNGSVVLRATAHDPLDEIEVVEVQRALYMQDDSAARCESVATVPADAFLPYHHGRFDDWLALDTAPPRSVA
jgi:acetoacetate decarboxylase